MPLILDPDFGPCATVVNPGGRAGICLVCEHASAKIPAGLNDLGLSDEDRFSHAVWDLGAEVLARRMSDILDAPLVLSRVSRLVYDCNRPPEAPDCIPARTERIEVPGNSDLTEHERVARVEEIYEPFHRKVAETLDGFAAPPALVTVHSFTPTWHGVPRTTEVGLLHDEDPRLVLSMQAAAPTVPAVALNQPYSAADGVTHTLRRHANARGLLNVMIEVRNDLLGEDASIVQIAEALTGMLNAALAKGADAA